MGCMCVCSIHIAIAHQGVLQISSYRFSDQSHKRLQEIALDVPAVSYNYDWEVTCLPLAFQTALFHLVSPIHSGELQLFVHP